MASDTALEVSWAAAGDDVSAPEAITYAVYKGEGAAVDLSAPAQVTSAGATSALVSGLASGKTYSFVVHARDAAGNEDANDVVVSGATSFMGRTPARQLGSFATAGDLKRIATWSNRMFLALGTAGIEVDDITDPPQPIRLGTADVAERALDVSFDSARRLLYVADGAKGLTVFDLKDWANPKKLVTFDPGLAGATTVAVAANEQYAWLATTSGTFAIDVSAPTAPVVLQQSPVKPLHLALGDGTLYGTVVETSTTGVMRWDVKDGGLKAFPAQTSIGSTGPTGLVVDGLGRVYLATSTYGVSILAADSTNALKLLGGIAVTGGAMGVGIERNTLAIGSSDAFLVYNIADVAKPELVSANAVPSAAKNVAVSRGLGIYLYKANGGAATDLTGTTGSIVNVPPFATAAVPGSNTAAPLNTAIYFDFSKAMDPASLTSDAFTVTANGAAVAGTVAWEWSNQRLAFTPSAPLANGTTYTVKLAGTLADTRGDKLYPAEGISYSFSTKPAVPPTATPSFLRASPSDRAVSLSWGWVSGATNYYLYWSETPGVTKASNRVMLWGTGYWHTGLTNGKPYYYAVSAEGSAGESALSAEVSATPVPPPPPAPPQYAWAYPGNANVTVNWYSSYGALRYNVYWSLSPNQPLSARTKISTVGRPFSHTGLTNGQAYYYVVTAENDSGESLPSPEVAATPTAPVPPQQVSWLTAQGGDARVYLSWAWAQKASWYNVYAATQPNGGGTVRKIARLYGTSYTDWNVTNGVPVYYTVTAENDGGESPKSVEVSALPLAPPPPAAPTGVGASAGDKQARLWWSSSTYGVRYNLYWSTTPGVTRLNGAKLANVWSGYTHYGLTNGQTYYYVVTAENSGGESAESSEIAVTPMPPPIPAAPQGLSATGGDGVVRLAWGYAQGATSYTIYFSQTSPVNRATASRLYAGSYPGYYQYGVQNGVTLYYVVTASNSGGESAPSAEVSATPMAPPAPALAPMLSGTASDTRNYLSWSYVTGATWYNVYWSTTPGVTTASTKAANVWPTWSHWGLTNNQTYYYRVAAANTGGEGPLSPEIALTPLPPAIPATPASLKVTPADRYNSLSWGYSAGATTYNIYWQVGPGVTKSSSKIATYYSYGYTHWSLLNGTQYCYAVSAQNSGGESALSAEQCATPQPPPAPAYAPSARAIAYNTAVYLSWNYLGDATGYAVYFKQGGGVTKQNGTRLAVGNSATYWHAGLTNGTQYCYVVAGYNNGGEGPASSEVCATPTAPPPPSTPPNFTATPGNGSVTVSFSGVSNALRYNLYWSTTSPVSKATATKVAGVYSGYTVYGLTNSTPYFFILTAENDGGESAPTAEVRATPLPPPPPGTPAGLYAFASANRVTLSWNSVANATGYKLYWSTTSPVSKSTATAVNVGTTDYSHYPLTNGVTYYYAVSAVNASGESALSSQVSATPSLARPTNLTATAAPNQATLTWSSAQGAQTYNLYWSNTTGVTRATGTKIASVSSGYVHQPLTNGVTYFYVVTAVSATGEESAESNEARAAPQALPAPFGVTATASSAAVTVRFQLVSGASSYNVYYGTATGVTKATGTKVPNAVYSGTTVSGLTNGTTYYFVVTAVAANGSESAESAQVSATPQSTPPPNPPQGVSATPGNGQVTIAFQQISGVSGYTVYYGTTNPVTKANASTSWTDFSPWAITGLTNGTTYYFVVTATGVGGESAFSAQVSSTPTAAPPAAPTGVYATAASGQITLNWSAVSGATTYNVYWSNSSTVSKTTGTKIASVTSPYVHTGLTNGTAYYYVVTAVNAAGESAASTVTSAVPSLQAPTGLMGAAGNNQATLTWQPAAGATGYNLYWSTTGTPTKASAKLAGVTSPYAHTGLTNGTTYWYAVSAVSGATESNLSNVVSVVPAVPTGPNLFASPGYRQVNLNLSYSAAGQQVRYYNVYFATTTGVTPQNGTRLSFTNGYFQHTGLTVGTTYYYVATAVTDAGESPVSQQVSATPALPTSFSVSGSPRDAAIAFQSYPPQGAVALSIYLSTTTPVNKATATKVAYDLRTNSAVATGLTNGTPYYFIATASYPEGDVDSSQGTATPAAGVAPPRGLYANGQLQAVYLNWSSNGDAAKYNIYFSTTTGVTPQNGTKLAYYPRAGETYSQFVHSGLTNGTTYYYVVTSVSAAGLESAPTTQASATPAWPTPNIQVAGINTGLAVTVQQNNSAAVPSGYNFYYSTTSPPYPVSSTWLSGATKVSSTATSYQITGLTNGTTYFVVATALYGSTESPPSGSQRGVAGYPQTYLSANGAPSEITLQWQGLAGATAYNLYWSTTTPVSKTTGTKIAVPLPSNPSYPTYKHTGLTQGTTYYYVVAAVYGSTEGPDSNIATAKADMLAPSYLNASSQPEAVNLNWGGVNGATGYNLYWGTSSTVSPSTGTKIALGAVNNYRHTGLTNNTAYYYVLTAVNGTTETAPCPVAVAIPSVGSAITNVYAQAGDQSVLLNWFDSGTKFNLYWSTTSNVSKASPNKIAGLGAGYAHTGLTNGTTYYYVVTRVSPTTGEESPESAIVAATPAQKPPTLSLKSVTTTSATLQIGGTTGATSYNLYYGSASGVTRTTGTKITDIAIGDLGSGTMAWTHAGLTTGTAVYYVVTAITPSGETLESNEVVATPRAGPTGLTVTMLTSNPRTYHLTWTAAPGALMYKVYCSNYAGGTAKPADGGLPCITSSTTSVDYTVSNTVEYFSVTAVDANGETAGSGEAFGVIASAAPAQPALPGPVAGDKMVVLSWQVPNGGCTYTSGVPSCDNPATAWDLYYGTAKGVTTATGTKIADVKPPFVHGGLTNGQQYSYILVARNPAGASTASSEVGVTPSAAASGAWGNVGFNVTPTGARVASGDIGLRGATPFTLLAEASAAGVVEARVRTLGSSGWADVGTNPLNLDPAASVGSVSLAVDATSVYAAFTEPVGTARRNDVVIKKFDGTSWARMGASFVTRAANVLDLKVVAGKPTILYRDVSAAGTTQILARAWDGSAWNLLGTTVSSTAGAYEGRLADFNGTPVALIHEYGAGTGTQPSGSPYDVRKFASNAWSTLTAVEPPSGASLSEVSFAASTTDVYVAMSYYAGEGKSTIEAYSAGTGTLVRLGTIGQGIYAPKCATVGGTLYVATRESDAQNQTVARVRKWTGTDFLTVGTPVRYGTGTSLDAPVLLGGATAPYLVTSETMGEGSNSAVFLQTVAP